MAGTSLLALIDDIVTVLDDVAAMTKVAAKKTAGVLGDDLALNAEQVSGVRAKREIPVVWAVAKGSFINKLILVPAALLISVTVPWLILPLLMIGGAYLCYEGFEKVYHHIMHAKEEKEADQALVQAFHNPKQDMVAFEQKKIKGAIRTDFILSAEIIVIALGTVANQPFSKQAMVVASIALFMTVAVYGLVAVIVKLDDAGLHLLRTQGETAWVKVKKAIGSGLLSFAPFLMRSLSIIGTAAMFMVGGGILVHGVPFFTKQEQQIEHWVETIPAVGDIFAWFIPTLYNAVFGILAGGVVLLMVTLVIKAKSSFMGAKS